LHLLLEKEYKFGIIGLEKQVFGAHERRSEDAPRNVHLSACASAMRFAALTSYSPPVPEEMS